MAKENKRRIRGPLGRVQAPVEEIKEMLREIDDFFARRPSTKGEFEREILDKARAQVNEGEVDRYIRLELSKLYHNVIETV